MNPLPFILLAITLPLLLGGCGGDTAEEVDSGELARVGLPMNFERLDFESLEKWAEKGNIEAQREMADRYWYGVYGVETDKFEAYNWHLKCADQGDARSQFNVGFIIAGGSIDGVNADAVTGLAWIKIAVGNGFPPDGMSNHALVEFLKDKDPKQITKAEALVKEMVKKNPKLINE